MRHFIFIPAMLALWMSAPPALAASDSVAQVPFIGCKVDGITGKDAAPKDTGGAPFVPEAAAPYLAFYAVTNAFGILGPRGWYCFDYYYSDQEYLLVSPDPATGRDKGVIPELLGPAVQLTYLNIDTSGRFDVAAVAARLFPSQRKFVDGVIAEGIAPASEFSFGPYPDDTLTRMSANDVAFVTPPDHEGMGTNSQLVKNRASILGEAIFGPRGIIIGDVRLPVGLQNLSSEILGQVRQTAPLILNHN